jgi:uncharacterized protein (DUF302 family)
MPKTKINLTEKLYDDEGNPIQANNESYLSVLQRLAGRNIKDYNSTKQLLEEIYGEFSQTEKTVGEYLKEVAQADVGDKEENAVEDFDIYLDLRTSKSEVSLDEEKEIKRLKEKLKKTGLSTLIIGQLNSILSGKGNPMKPTYQGGQQKKKKEPEKAD